MNALSTSPTAASATHGDDDRRALLEEQWRQQLADVVSLSYETLPADGGEDDGRRASELLIANRLLAAARQQLADTEAALARLDDGSYGRCEDCAGAISPERLEILPAARFCVACQARHALRR